MQALEGSVAVEVLEIGKSRPSYVPLTGNFQTLVDSGDEDLDACMDE